MKNFFNLGFVVLILVVLGCNCSKLEEFAKNNGGESSPTPGASPYATSSPASTPASSPSNLTKAKYDQIKKGTPRSEVEELLGGKGEEVSSSSGGGHTYTVVKWADKNFAYIIVTFDNGKVWTQAQGGLK